MGRLCAFENQRCGADVLQLTTDSDGETTKHTSAGLQITTLKRNFMVSFTDLDCDIKRSKGIVVKPAGGLEDPLNTLRPP